MTGWVLFAVTFLACMVEAVEAATVVLAVGVTRSWRSAFRGVALGVVVVAAVVAILGPTLTTIPISALRLVVGALLLVFGLGWLRKAILRASGWKALHDEEAIFAKTTAGAKAIESPNARGFHGGDPYSFSLAFKSVVLEGLEVAFIVVTFGANAHDIPLGAVAAIAAIAVTVVVAAIVRGPLSKVPENTIKFVVGALLTSFGTFWGAEGAGAHWPGTDLSLVVIIPATIAIALVMSGVLHMMRTSARRGSGSTAVAA
ncbi:MAG: COG4280 domain-containing protein [Acidimicrobiales bacterium]